jgi:hypothetical protein
MSLIPEDDFRHAPCPAQWWNGSFYFNSFDSGGRLGGFIGFSLAFGLTDGSLVLRLGEGTLLIARACARGATRDGEAVVAAGALTAQCEEPLTRWQIAYDGDAFVISDPRKVAFFTASPRVRRRPCACAAWSS